MLRAAVTRDRFNLFAWRQLGTVYAARGDMPRANLASAEQQVMSGDYIQAVRSARNAQAGLTQNSADWLRAQDIEMEARGLLDRQEKQGRGRRG